MELLFPLRASDVRVNSGPSGWLYVLSNYAMPDLVKIGYTCVGLEERIRQLQNQTVNPGIFVLELFFFTDSVDHHEKHIFLILDRFRIEKRREFFVGSPKLAYYALKDYFEREPDWIHPRLKETLL